MNFNQNLGQYIITIIIIIIINFLSIYKTYDKIFDLRNEHKTFNYLLIKQTCYQAVSGQRFTRTVPK
jgi:hypothetical protein